MNDIVFLRGDPFLKRDYDRLGIELLKKNFSVKILDFTAWLNPSFWKTSSINVYGCQEHLIISCKEDFLNAHES